MLKQSKNACCFTGHRKLNAPIEEIKENLYEAITHAIILKDCKRFICGGAIGFDTLAAELVLEAKNIFHSLTLEIAVPCENQSESWSQAQKEKYDEIISQADKVTLLSTQYTKNCMQKRNEYMVDNSSLVIAHYDGSAGGTKNTFEYAKKHNKEIVLV